MFRVKDILASYQHPCPASSPQPLWLSGSLWPRPPPQTSPPPAALSSDQKPSVRTVPAQTRTPTAPLKRRDSASQSHIKCLYPPMWRNEHQWAAMTDARCIMGGATKTCLMVLWLPDIDSLYVPKLQYIPLMLPVCSPSVICMCSKSYFNIPQILSIYSLNLISMVPKCSVYVR